ncbi:aldehyde dehydrogenase [Gordonia sp. NPDC127522]|uniref:aldehyde dehydrogenase n=1 Tax=Gordonia sp. NPDC127522 TaxID=3345390 RepID=UPI003640A4FE
MKKRVQNFIDGEWRASSGTETITIVNPTTEEPYGVVGVATPEDVDAAVTSAHRALNSDPWRGLSLTDRRRIVARVGDLLAVRSPELARIASETTGAVYRNWLSLGDSVNLIRMYLEAVEKIQFEYVRRDAHGDSLITRRPVGVVAGIVPWNAPIRSEVKKVIPALLAGCTIVVKPSPEVTFGAAVFAEICSEAGVPPGVVNMVPGGPSTGDALVRHPLVRKVAFTGSTATGARIAEASSDTFKRLQLELGGKSAAVLLDDFELEATMPWMVRGNWSNSGQICVGLTRVLVPRSRHDELVGAFVQAAAEQVVGDPLDEATTMGPLVTQTHRRKVLNLIAAGVAEGADLVAGGGVADRRGWFVEPTVFAGVSNDMRIAREEFFGPVATIIPYDTVDQAVAIANDSDYGLHGAVFGADELRALDVARRIDTGSMGINRAFMPHSAPFGGVKQSGIGREHGVEGFDSFLEYVSYNLPPTLADRLT